MIKKDLISLDEFIKLAKSKGVSFGKSDPYNRLRYYTKISLLPHMERKSEKGSIKAYYPKEAIDTLLKIENLKKSGLSNEEIAEKFAQEEKSPLPALKTLVTRKNLVLAIIMLLLVVVYLNKTGVIKLSQEGNITSLTEKGKNQTVVIDSGVGIVPAGKSKTFVKSNKVAESSQIQVTFKSSYSPAENYYVETKVPGEGFVLSLDNQTAEDSNFSFWVTQN